MEERDRGTSLGCLFMIVVPAAFMAGMLFGILAR